MFRENPEKSFVKNPNDYCKPIAIPIRSDNDLYEHTTITERSNNFFSAVLKRYGITHVTERSCYNMWCRPLGITIDVGGKEVEMAGEKW